MIAPDAVARQVLPWRGVLGRDAGPVALQLLGHQLGQAGQCALTHFGADYSNHHSIVWLNHNPNTDFWGAGFIGTLCMSASNDAGEL